MMSTKIETYNGQLKNPFASSQSVYAGFHNTFSQYKNSFEANFQMLKRRFTHQDPNKIKQLLDEFDNNPQMVSEILISSQDKHQMIAEKPINKKAESDEENKLLKSAIARLYRRLVQVQKEAEGMKILNQKLKRQNEDLKLQNRFLLEKQFGSNQFSEQRDVY